MSPRTAPKPFKIKDYLAARKATVDGYLDDFLPSSTTYPEVIHEAMRYSIFAGGKRLRPILALSTGEALEGDFSQLIYLACALEMIHTYSLIHDDLPAMDNDDIRRGQPTAHRKFGEAFAILAGNGLLTQAFQLLVEIPGHSRLPERKLKIVHYLCRAIGTSRGIIAGQAVDLLSQGKAFSKEELEYIHSRKTGALIEASVYCAALLSNAEEDARLRLKAYGTRLGLAFQIVDDILDVEASSSDLGKTSGKDTTLKKATYPALYGVEKSRQIVEELYQEAIQEISFLGQRAQALQELARFIAQRRS